MIEWEFDDIHESLEPVIYDHVEQRTDEWRKIRAGYITGSKASHMMAEGEGKTRDKYKIELAVERMTGISEGISFQSKAMVKGNEHEPLAREHYEFINDVDVRQVAFIQHHSIPYAGVSPDGLIDDDGVLEIKCPNMTTHAEYLISKKIPGNYMTQMQWALFITGREYCDWMTYCHEMPIKLRAMIIRVVRNEERIKELEQAAIKFNQEIDELIAKLESA